MTRSRRHPYPQRGFTLVELMVVIVILGGLIVLVGPNVWNALFQSRVGTAEVQMKNFETAIDLYRMHNKELPNSLQDLTEATDDNPNPAMESVPPDPWGNEFIYRRLDGNRYEIRSYGDDGQAETDDDLVWPPPRDD